MRSQILPYCLTTVFVCIVLLMTISAQEDSYDLLIKGGHVIDPRNGIDDRMDVAVAGGRIALVAPEIPVERARQVVDAAGLYVTPGLVDIHVHAFYGTRPDSDYSDGFYALPPDGFTFRSGVTTVVDTGGSGWRNFIQFKEQVIDRSQTRVLALLNIVGSGMKGDPIEQNLLDMDPKLTAQRARQFPETIVGIKVAHYRGDEWDPVDRAVEAGRQADLPVMVDFGRHLPELSLEELLLNRLRPGDLLTHTYAEVEGRIAILDSQGQLRSFVPRARARGVLFDVGHGGGSFVFRQAVPAVRLGFQPDSISTDLHANSMNAGMKDMLNVMSKFLNLGLSLPDVILRSTWNPARFMRREEQGHLSPGAPADLALLSLREGSFGFVDVDGFRMDGRLKLECELTLRDGRIVWDLNGLSRPPQKEN